MRNYLSRPVFVEKDGVLVYRTELMAAHERIDELKAALDEIAIVCTANMDRNSDHRIALANVRQIANDALSEDVKS